MNRLLGWAPAAADRLNPILIKEFRQAVRSRLVIAVLILFLIVDLTVLGCYLLLSPEIHASSSGGRAVFMVLVGILWVTCLLFVPLYAGVRIALERNDANTDLLFITTITAGAIIRGKYLTAMALTLLIYSACMPFVVFTYLLRGIDLPTIFFLLAVGFLVCAAANAVGIFAGCIPGSWFMRGLVGLGLLFILLVAIYATLAWVSFSFMFGFSRPTWDAQFWGALGTIVFLVMLGIGFLHVMSVALISPKASNRMLMPRVYIAGCWAITGVVTAVWSWIYSAHAASEVMLFWVFGSGITFACLAVLALGERDSWTRRVRRTIPQNPLMRRIAFLLYTGSAGGIIWCSVMFAATLLASFQWVAFLIPLATHARTGDAEFWELCANWSIVFGYVLCYCLTAAFLRIVLLKKMPTIYLPFVAIFLGLALSLGPYFVAFFLTDPGHWRADETWYLVGGPMVLSSADHYSRPPIGMFLAAWLGAGLLGAMPWFIGQWRRFVPYQASARVQGSGFGVQEEDANCKLKIENIKLQIADCSVPNPGTESPNPRIPEP